MTFAPHEVLPDLTRLGVGRIAQDVSLRSCSYWRIGGPADLLVEPTTADEVGRLVAWLNARQLPWVVIGDGCNLLFDDAGIRGVVIRIGRALSAVRVEGQRIHAKAGAFIPCLAHTAANAGLTGLEHTIGIPGTLGGLVLMNGGSLRRGIGDNVLSVEVVNPDGSLQTLSREECTFSYRHSALQGSGRIVVGATLECATAPAASVRRDMQQILHDRKTRFPLKLPNCGSVFLNDPDIYAAWGPPGKVIEDTGLKGTRIGAIEVSPLHANFMVNHGDGRSADVLALIRRVREQVHGRTGAWLSCEVRYVAPDARLMPAHLAADPESA